MVANQRARRFVIADVRTRDDVHVDVGEVAGAEEGRCLAKQIAHRRRELAIEGPQTRHPRASHAPPPGRQARLEMTQRSRERDRVIARNQPCGASLERIDGFRVECGGKERRPLTKGGVEGGVAM